MSAALAIRVRRRGRLLGTGRRVAAANSRGLVLIDRPESGLADTLDLAPDSTGHSKPGVTDLSRLGGDFLGWTKDGETLYYAIGHSLFLHDFAAASRAHP